MPNQAPLCMRNMITTLSCRFNFLIIGHRHIDSQIDVVQKQTCLVEVVGNSPYDLEVTSLNHILSTYVWE